MSETYPDLTREDHGYRLVRDDPISTIYMPDSLEPIPVINDIESALEQLGESVIPDKLLYDVLDLHKNWSHTTIDRRSRRIHQFELAILNPIPKMNFTKVQSDRRSVYLDESSKRLLILAANDPTAKDLRILVEIDKIINRSINKLA